jgi:hypothetical protein
MPRTLSAQLPAYNCLAPLMLCHSQTLWAGSAAGHKTLQVCLTAVHGRSVTVFVGSNVEKEGDA